MARGKGIKIFLRANQGRNFQKKKNGQSLAKFFREGTKHLKVTSKKQTIQLGGGFSYRLFKAVRKEKRTQVKKGHTRPKILKGY